MVFARSLFVFGALGALALTSACAASVSSDDHHDDGVENDEDHEGESLGTVSSALSNSDPVSTAVGQSCSTTAVKALAIQLVDEIQCMKPGSMKRIDNLPGLSLGSAVFPYLQTSAANALINVQKARGVTMSINSGLRTLPQQYLLYRWYQTNRCGISLAAKPGTSNHESGIAVDVNDNTGWRPPMAAKSFHWLGASDPVHFDFTGGGTIDMSGLSVLAFQRLWNRNNPNDKIGEDGDFGPSTEARLAKSPVGGFATGALCTQSQPPANGDAPADGADPNAIDPNAPSSTNEGDPSDNASSDATTTGATVNAPRMKNVDQGGCAVHATSSSPSRSAGLIAAAALIASVIRRRRRK